MQVCLLLMDTQGIFDNETSQKECAAIFSLSAIMSSVQIFNIKNNIEKRDLEYMSIFAQYKSIFEKSFNKIFKFEVVFVFLSDSIRNHLSNKCQFVAIVVSHTRLAISWRAPIRLWGRQGAAEKKTWGKWICGQLRFIIQIWKKTNNSESKGMQARSRLKKRTQRIDRQL